MHLQVKDKNIDDRILNDSTILTNARHLRSDLRWVRNSKKISHTSNANETNIAAKLTW